MHDYIAALRGLTVRGCSFLAAGGACIAAAAIIGEQDLLAVALLLLMFPLVAAAFVARTRYRLACTRRLDPPRVTAGDTVAVRIRLDNVSRLRSSVLLVEDVTSHLGHRARFVVDRIEPGGSRDLSYSMRAQTRGRYQVGPLTIRLTDPFGLCELERSFRGKDNLTVAPALERMPLVPSVGLSTLNNAVRRSSARAGDDESTTRPYQSGDDLRKVHWKTTARLGELTVRRSERPLTGAATVLLDTRADSWPADHPDGPFSWAVSAAGSIAVNLARSGYGVRLLTGSRVAATGPGNAVGALLDQLAVIEPSPSALLNPALASLRSAEHSGMVVVVLGRVDQATATLIAGARPRKAPAIAVLTDIAQWSAEESTAANTVEMSRHILTRHGWTVLVADRTTRLADTWPRIFRPGAGGGRTHSRLGGFGAGAGAGAAPGAAGVGGGAGGTNTPRPGSRPTGAGPRTPVPGSASGPGPAPGTAPGVTPTPAPGPTGPLYRPGSPYEPSPTAATTGGPATSAGRGW
ncbi:hypothetical protein ACG83_09785 [Frankia sp. R43]|uniref:DUF58 domain-containing protein n=1 Tax=Frankia sp. R43 TaxID=269536 RepID=UPI0006CA18E1|nr:DUF58 domain-containing protein [Frankia sp. R43]KPM55584.1 hypothetical protein ACG83_09785 [Frankia sp. R43]